MNLHRGAPCWSTQIIRTVRSSCCLISSWERSAACRCSAVSRSNCVTKPCLPTPRSTLIDSPLSVVAEDETGADRHEAPVGGLGEHEREQRVVVRVDAGRHHVRVEIAEPPHRIGDVVAVDGERAGAVDVAEVDLAAERLVDLTQRLEGLDTFVELILEEAPADLAVGAAFQPVGVVGPQRLRAVEEAVVAERELPGAAERLGVGIVDRGQLVGPSQVHKVAGGGGLHQVAVLGLVDVTMQSTLYRDLAAVGDPGDAPAETTQAVDLEGADEVVDLAERPRRVPGNGEHLAHLGSLPRQAAGTQMSGARRVCRVARFLPAALVDATVRV